MGNAISEIIWSLKCTACQILQPQFTFTDSESGHGWWLMPMLMQLNGLDVKERRIKNKNKGGSSHGCADEVHWYWYWWMKHIGFALKFLVEAGHCNAKTKTGSDTLFWNILELYWDLRRIICVGIGITDISKSSPSSSPLDPRTMTQI